MADKFAETRHGAVKRAPAPFEYEPETLILVTDPRDPQYDERVKMPTPRWLVDDIKENGVNVPIFVFKDGEDKETGKPRVKVVEGRQRVKALLIANKELVAEGKTPHLIVGFPLRGDDLTLFTTSVRLNEMRQADTPMVKARKLAHLVKLGATHELAGRCIVPPLSAQSVKDYIAMVSTAPEVQEAVDKGELPFGVAKKMLVGLSKEEQVATLSGMREKGELNGHAAHAAVENARGPARGRTKGGKVKRSRSFKDIAAKRRELLKGQKERSKAAQDRADLLVAALAWCEGDDKALDDISL